MRSRGQGDIAPVVPGWPGCDEVIAMHGVLAATAAEHSGVHQTGSVGFVLRTFDGMNLVIPLMILWVTRLHDVSGSSVMISVQSVSR